MSQNLHICTKTTTRGQQRCAMALIESTWLCRIRCGDDAKREKQGAMWDALCGRWPNLVGGETVESLIADIREYHDEFHKVVYGADYFDWRAA